MTFLDVDPDDPTRIVRLHDQPLLEVGVPGTFDDSGTQCNWAMWNGSEVWLYYLGWNLGITVPARNNTGLAVSDDGGVTFRKPFQGPVLDRTPHEPFFAYTPCILKEDEIYHCWYGSGRGWATVGEKLEGEFEIKYGHSTDGVNWTRPNVTCLPPLDPGEVNCRPSVIKDEDTYKMWFSYRGTVDFRDGTGSYKIGYAESKDRLTWCRRDDYGGLDHSDEGWDGLMTCFAQVADIGGRRLIFYNGNGFGATGFGFAEWRD